MMFAREKTADNGDPIITVHANSDVDSPVLYTIGMLQCKTLPQLIAEVLNDFYEAGCRDAASQTLGPTESHPNEPAAKSPARCTECGEYATRATPETPYAISHLADCPERLKRVDIKELRLSNRAYNLLKRNRINTIGKLLSKDRYDIIDLHNLGPNMLSEIEHKLAVYDPPLSLSAPENEQNQQ